MAYKTHFTLFESDTESLGSELQGLFPSMKEQAFVAKKIDGYAKRSVEQLRAGNKLEKIHGTGSPSLHELKIKGRVSVRFIAYVRDRANVLLLLAFKGSGSGGAVDKWVPKAYVRLAATKITITE